MYLVNFQLRADVVLDRGETKRLFKKRKVVILSFDREYDLDSSLDDKELIESGLSIRVTQSSGLLSCVNGMLSVELKEGTPDHAVMNEVILFMERWCSENNPFN